MNTDQPTNPPRQKSRLPFPVILAVVILGVVLILLAVKAIGASSVPDVNGVGHPSAVATVTLA